MKLIDLDGKALGSLKVLGVSHTDSTGRKYWNCICGCGTALKVRTDALTRGGSMCRACAAKAGNAASTTHGRCGSKEYSCWGMMKQRCRNPKAQMYSKYGGTGIDYDDRWEVFENFLEDMGPAPKGTSLDRKDNSKGYTKDNCRWATPREQTNNRGVTVWVDIEGKKTLLSDYAAQVGKTYNAVYMQYYRGNLKPWTQGA